VIAPAVGLDDEPELAPVEVDPTAKLDLRVGKRQLAPAKDPQQALKLGLRHPVGMPVDELSQRPDTPLPPPLLERAPQRLRIDQVELVRLADGRLELVA
jgi:hypothetical protein